MAKEMREEVERTQAAEARLEKEQLRTRDLEKRLEDLNAKLQDLANNSQLYSELNNECLENQIQLKDLEEKYELNQTLYR